MTSSSGTYDFSLSNGDAVISAFERIKVRAPSIRQEHLRTARNEINLMFAEWSNKQVNIWKTEKIQITLVSGTATYTIPTRVVMMLDTYLTLNDGLTTQIDRYITPISRTEWASYASKFTPGLPTSYFYERLIAPQATFWPVINTTGYVINYYACTQVQDAALTGGETPDIPYLWTDAFVAGLAHRLSRTYATELEQVRKADAMEAWTIAATQNTENVPVRILPNISGYYR
jgi:hypothetical protein